jgi:hypothetical protein
MCACIYFSPKYFITCPVQLSQMNQTSVVKYNNRIGKAKLQERWQITHSYPHKKTAKATAVLDLLGPAVVPSPFCGVFVCLLAPRSCCTLGEYTLLLLYFSSCVYVQRVPVRSSRKDAFHF